MRYNWDVNEIRNNINTLKRMIGKTPSDELILDHISQYYAMLDCVVKHWHEELDTKEMSIQELIKIFLANITKKDCALVDLLIDTWPIIQNYSCSNLVDTVVCNNELLIQNTENFLRAYTNHHVYEKYAKLKKENPNYLHITKLTKGMGSIRGITFIDGCLNKKKIILFRDNTFMDLVSLPHELFHAIFNDYDCYQTLGYQSSYTNEIEGSLANLLAADYYRKDLPDISKQTDEQFLFEYQNNIRQLIISFSYLTACNNCYSLRKNKFAKLLNMYGIEIPSDGEIRDTLSQQCDSIINYSLSYLASIDLLAIYNADPEFALYLLGNICFIKKDDNVLNILRRNHITFMDDGFDNFKKYVKRIESNQ